MFATCGGAHFNPAVTYCLYLIGQVDFAQLVYYTCAQCAGGAIASLLLWGSVSAINEDRDEIAASLVGNPPFHLGASGLNPA